MFECFFFISFFVILTKCVHVWHSACVRLCVHVLPWCTVDQADPQIRLSGWEQNAAKNSDAPCAGREAVSDVFLDGLNNECLKRLLGPQLPNLPLSSVLTCSSCTRLEKEGKEEGVSTFTKATCCLCHQLSLGMAKDHEHVSSGFSSRLLLLLKLGEHVRTGWDYCMPPAFSAASALFAF